MPTIEASIQTALFARAASLVLSPVHPVAWPNVSFTVPASKKYVRVTHFPNSTDRLYLGNNDPHRHQGILQLTVVAPINSGEALAREIAGQIADHFRAGLKLNSSGVRVNVTKRPNTGSVVIDTTEIRIPVSIAYRAFK